MVVLLVFQYDITFQPPLPSTVQFMARKSHKANPAIERSLYTGVLTIYRISLIRPRAD